MRAESITDGRGFQGFRVRGDVCADEDGPPSHPYLRRVVSHYPAQYPPGEVGVRGERYYFVGRLLVDESELVARVRLGLGLGGDERQFALIQVDVERRRVVAAVVEKVVRPHGFVPAVHRAVDLVDG